MKSKKIKHNQTKKTDGSLMIIFVNDYFRLISIKLPYNYANS